MCYFFVFRISDSAVEEADIDFLILHLGENEDPINLAEALTSLPGVLQADPTDHQVAIVTPSAEKLLAPIVSRTNELGIRIYSVDMREPNLEAVFLHLTGRALRE